MTNRKTLAACLAVGMSAAVVAGSGARAEGRPLQQELRIPYGDLDIADASDQDRLKLRVMQGARALCRSGGPQAVEVWKAEKACFSRALAQGYAQADALFAGEPKGTVVIGAIVISGR
ncbi:UrcA family protein [Sphingomicrobium aestuariivivum]|uniref:UrcA family protein n=1 Tax=Sphingomicrobium aestuariivivum TaxID=1582356 RepID=UPI001FD6E9F8|nr:UrcA family protein [Sphingomicrobium aestuariivivum]MCJ8190344.1 UrcA family protein [Sphingomicrobium aestuariivivum]